MKYKKCESRGSNTIMPTSRRSMTFNLLRVIVSRETFLSASSYASRETSLVRTCPLCFLSECESDECESYINASHVQLLLFLLRIYRRCLLNACEPVDRATYFRVNCLKPNNSTSSIFMSRAIMGRSELCILVLSRISLLPFSVRICFKYLPNFCESEIFILIVYASLRRLYRNILRIRASNHYSDRLCESKSFNTSRSASQRLIICAFMRTPKSYLRSPCESKLPRTHTYA